MGSIISRGTPQASSLEPALAEGCPQQIDEYDRNGSSIHDSVRIEPATPTETASSLSVRQSSTFPVNWRLDPPKSFSDENNISVCEKLEAIRKAACAELQVPRCRIAMIGSVRYWIMTPSGSLSPSFQADSSSPFTVCYENYLQNNEDCLIVTDMSKDPRFESLDVVKHSPYVKFFAGTPIISTFDNRQCIGIFYLPDFKARKPFEDVEIGRIKTIANEIAAVLQEDTVEHIKGSDDDKDSVPAVPSIIIDTSASNWDVLKTNSQWKQLTGIATDDFCSGGGFFNLLSTENDEGMLSLRQAVASSSDAISEGADPESIHSKVCIMTPLDVSGASLQFSMVFKPASAEEISDLVQNGYNGARHHIWKSETHLRRQIQIGNSFDPVHLPCALSSIGSTMPHTAEASGEPSSSHFQYPSTARAGEDGTTGKFSGKSDASINSIGSSFISEIYDMTLPPRLRALQIGKLIGSGSYGVVYYGNLAGSLPVAVKFIYVPPVLGPANEQMYNAWSEFMIGTDMLHENLVKTLDWVQTGWVNDSHPATIMIVQELCNRGPLWSALDRGLLRKNGDSAAEPDMRAVIETAVEIARGMQYLHGKSFLHGDLSANNVMLCSANNSRGFIAKVTDFGMGRIPNANIATQRAGTVNYMAKELLIDGVVSQAADVYSYGVLLWELIRSEHAWHELNFAQIIFAVTVKGEKLKLPEDAPADYADLAYRCMADEPSERPTFDEIAPILEQMFEKLPIE